MKKYIFLKSIVMLFTIILSSASWAQQEATDTTIITNSKLVDKLPMFGKDEFTFKYYVDRYLVYPSSLEGKEGRVVARFVVEKDGSVKFLTVEQSLGLDSDNNIKRLLEKMPKWNPAQSKGLNVRFMVTRAIDVYRPSVTGFCDFSLQDIMDFYNMDYDKREGYIKNKDEAYKKNEDTTTVRFLTCKNISGMHKNLIYYSVKTDQIGFNTDVVDVALRIYDELDKRGNFLNTRGGFDYYSVGMKVLRIGIVYYDKIIPSYQIEVRHTSLANQKW